MVQIQVSKLGKEYDGKSILRDINLGIERGEVFAIIGPTGAGKTTFLRLFDLLELPSTGRLYFDGIDVTRNGHRRLQARRKMAYVQQKPIVFSMNVYGNVACGLKWRHVRKSTIREKVDSALEMVGMADFKYRDARTLSGGETQRVAIARALVTEPEILLLDEPTANLDPVSVAKVEEVLTRIIAERKTTVVMATHDMSQGQRMADRIGVLINGKLPQVGTPKEIFCSPSDKEVAELVGVENILAGVVAGKKNDLALITVNEHEIQAITRHAEGEAVYVMVRPEDIVFTPSRDVSSARNVFSGEIRSLSSVGPLVRVEVDCGFPLLGVMTMASSQEMGLTIGRVIYANFKATAVHVIKRF
jgi:tungstate transport system ATP-binding protein